jgi:hypothetical protein
MSSPRFPATVTRIRASWDGQIGDYCLFGGRESILLSEDAPRPLGLSPADDVIFIGAVNEYASMWKEIES